MDQKIPLLIVHLETTELPHGLGMSLSSTQAIMRHGLSEPDYRSADRDIGSQASRAAFHIGIRVARD